MGKIVLEDFNEGNGYYKVNLAYLNKEQVEEIENLVSKWNPTDEDIKSCIAMCLTDVNEQRFKDYGTNLRDCLAWLERQGEQKPTKEKMITPEESLGIDSGTYNKIVDECIFGEQKAEENKGNIGEISPNWSEEDEEFLRRAINAAKDFYPMTAKWLKSLKDRYTWKPSDEQIGCLSDAIEHYNSLGYPASKLKELLNDLKKLKEE